MSTVFPGALDTLVNPTAVNPTDAPSHSGQHSDANDAIEAMQAKIGVNSSVVTTSLDYKVSNAASANPGHTHNLASGGTDVTSSAAELNQLDGVTVGGNASGDIVTTDDTQTLTGKTIAGGSNTLSGLTHGSQVDNPTSGVHGATGTIVGTSDNQALTNKTINGTLNTISNINLASQVTGNLPVTNLDSGTSASGTTFWRGDGAWGTPPGAASPLTTKGDLYTRNATVDVALPVGGTNGWVLKVNSATTTGLEWGAAPGGASPLSVKGDLYGFDTANAAVPVGTNGQVLTADSSDAQGVSWQTPIGSASFVINETPTGTINGVNTSFDTSTTYVASTIQVYLDGQLQKVGASFDYVETDSNTITFNTAPVTGSVLLVSYQHLVSTSGNADTVDGYNANATPTASNIPVLDSNALLPEAIGAYNYSMSQQAIINGNFDVWQRGVTVTNPGATTFISDRWKINWNYDGGTPPTTIIHSKQSLTPGDIANAFFHYRIAPNGAGSGFGTNSVSYVSQRIENGTRYLCGLNKKVTVSFWARSSITNKKISIALQQLYGNGGSPSSFDILPGTYWTLTSSWTKYTHTFTTSTLVGKTFGTNDDDVLELLILQQWGTTVGTNYGLGSAESYVGSGNIDIAQVQLCAGSEALPFEPKSFSQELNDCMRYYQKSYAYGTSPGTATTYGAFYLTVGTATASALYGNIYLPVSMRATPNYHAYDSTGAIDKVYKGGLGKTADYPALYPTSKTLLIGTVDVTPSPTLEFQWTAEAEL
jgi:hypothetical protein